MESSNNKVQALKDQIVVTEKELSRLKEQLASIEENQSSGKDETKASKWPLNPEEYLRYGRQMIVPSIGVGGRSHEA